MMDIKIQFKTKNPKQLEASEAWVDSDTEQILYGGAKGGGKSYLGAALIFGDALIYPGTHYFIARKELNDLRKYTIPTIHEVIKNFGINMDDYVKFNGQDNYYTLYNDSKVFLISCKDEPSDPLFERFGSMQMTRGWIEEGGEVPEAAKENLWLSIGRWMNKDYNLKKKLLITANPKKGWMKREFVDLFKQDLLPKSRKYIQAFATDNKYLPDDYIITLSNQKNKVARQRLFEGNWDYEEDKDSLIYSDALTDTFSNTIVKDNNKYLTVDVARKGEDHTVFSFWDGLELYRIERYNKQDTAETAQKIKDEASKEKIPFSHILIDEDGVGGGVVDNLFGTKGFVANSSPIPTANEVRFRLSRIKNEFTPKTNFANLKSQCGWKLAELINEHKIAFKVLDYRDVLIEDLTALLRDNDPESDGKLQLKPKSEVKEELRRSPDIGDTIIFRIWFELQKTVMIANIRSGEVVEKLKSQFERNRENFQNNSTR